MLFTVVVERLIEYLQRRSMFSESNSMILQQVLAEFCLYGLVAMGVFVCNNFVKVSEKDYARLEFADILCFIANCLLISVVAVLLVTYAPDTQTYLDYETCDVAESNAAGYQLGIAEFKIMARRFREFHKLPKHFIYTIYLKECYVRDVCDVMKVEWYTWGFLACFTLTFCFFKALYQSYGAMEASAFLRLMQLMNMIPLIVYLILYSHISSLYGTFLRSLPKMALEHSKEPIIHPMSKEWTYRFRWLLQIVSIANTLLLGAYFMIELFTIRDTQSSKWWYPMLVAPLVIGIVVLLPLITRKLSILDAFYAHNDEAMDAVLTRFCKVDEDMRYIRMLWECKGKPAPRMDEGDYDIDMFLKALAEDFELHVSVARGDRLFRCFDTDQNGLISKQEFMDGLNGKWKSDVRHCALVMDLG